MIKKTLAGLLAYAAVNLGSARAQPEAFVQEDAQTGYALVLVDMQQPYLDSVSGQELEEEIPYQIEVIQAAQRNNVPIFVLEYEDVGSTIPALRDALSASDYHVVTKSHNDGFIDTELDKLLEEHGTHSIVLAGVFASACVQATASGALDNGYAIVTSPEIIANDRGGDYMHESEGWYRENGTWIEDHDKLVQLIDIL